MSRKTFLSLVKVFWLSLGMFNTSMYHVGKHTFVCVVNVIYSRSIAGLLTGVTLMVQRVYSSIAPTCKHVELKL